MHPKVSQWKNKGLYFNFKGHQIFYIKEGSGPLLMIFHGYPYNSFDFHAIWDTLTSKYTVVIVDIIGMGFSDKPKNHEYTFQETAEIYKTLAGLLQIKEVHILAHDLGVSVVQELIAQDAEKRLDFKILSVAFLNGGLFMDVYKPRLMQRLLSESPAPVGKLLSKLISKKSIDKAISEVFGPQTKLDADLQDMFWDILTYNDGKSIAYLMGRLVFEKKHFQDRWISSMKKTPVPMCFINGPSDPNSGIHMVKRYKEVIPDPKVFMLPEFIGHWPQLEDPEGVLKHYASFRNEVS